MKKIITSLLLLLVSVTGLAKTVAIVNGQRIDSEIIDNNVNIIRQQMGSRIKDTRELRNNITNTAIVHTVIVQEALKLHLDQTKEYQDIINQALSDAKRVGEDKKANFKQEYLAFRENLLEQAYYIYIRKTYPVSESDIRKEYNDLINFYKNSKEIKIGQIITSNLQDAKRAIEDLNRGENFSQVATKYTIDPEGKRNGGIPNAYINMNDLKVAAPPLYEIIKNTPKGQYTTKPLQSGNTYAVFYVADLRQAKMPPFSELKDSLQAQLVDEKVTKEIDELVKKANIQRFDR